MRIAQFFGLVPKVADKSLPEGKSVIANNLDIYGNHLRPIKLPSDTGMRLLTSCGELFTGEPVSIHRAGSLYIAWDKLVFTAPDWTRKLGETTFLFVENGKLYRQSAERILAKQCPIPVGIKRPENAEVRLEKMPKAGCPKTKIKPLCIADNDCDNVPHPPVPTAYLFTYINACGEESAQSKPSEVVDIEWGDAAKVTVVDTPPENAVARRWYRAVSDNENNARWLMVGETPINQTEFYDNNCPCDFSCELSTDTHDAPPECLEGVAAIGDNLTVVWSNKHFWVSEHNFPHAYNLNNEYRLRFRIRGMYEVTPRIEGDVHYTLIAITEGMHYSVATDDPNQVEIAEIEQRYKCVNFNNVCQVDSEVIYSSEQGLVTISPQGEQLITGEIVTENEWSAYEPRTVRLTYHDDRIFGFTKDGGFILQIGSDKRRDSDFSTHNVVVQRGYTDEISPFIVVNNGHIYEWGKGENAVYDWKSQTQMMAGLWRPVACKVVSPDFDNIMPRGHREAKIKYEEWRRQNPYADDKVFFCKYPEFQQHYSHLIGNRPSVTVIIYADGREYFRKKVYSNKPFLLPRRYKAIDWAVRVIGLIRVDEIHLESSRESLLGGK